MTLARLNRDLIVRLTPLLGESEARSAARAILEDVRGVTQKDIFMYGDRTVEESTVDRCDAIVNRIADGEPVQYAVGLARFYGMDLYVAEGVLIPRPETEGLVDMIVSDAAGRSDMTALDCGTGSGCIAIALTRNLPFAKVDAIDISPKALEIARRNAVKLNVDINFIDADLLNMASEPRPKYDIIVSNPPYIADSEASDMDSRVKDHEPALALFVPDDDPLRFYRAIAVYAATALRSGGKLYFEINPRFVKPLKGMLADKGFTDIDIFRDYLGRERFARAVYPRR